MERKREKIKTSYLEYSDHILRFLALEVIESFKHVKGALPGAFLMILKLLLI